MKATKCVNAMPAGRSRDLYVSHAAFRRIVAEQGERILGVVNNVIRSQGIRGSIVNRADNEDKFELLQECNDALLEKINTNLDDLLGYRNPQDALIVSENFVEPESRKSLNRSWTSQAESSTSIKSAKLLTARNIQRPQATFKTPVDNSNNAFCPRLTYKPHSIKPLAILPEYDEQDQIIAYTHPYEVELEKFEPDEEVLKEKEPIQPVPIESGDLMYVDTENQLKVALSEMQKETELAVDVEHHSYRTFQGITCLLQISTRTKDYIFDTIALREELHILNEVFTNPKILKVFHGAMMDVDWLQRDLSIYIVNMFDTFEASKRLNFARFSLAFLLNHYCKIDVDKTFQLADWRMRPLLEELIDYARQDTHYLLFIYDCCRNDLLKASHGNTNLLKSVYQASKETCKKRFNKPQIGPNSFMDIYRKSKKVFDNRQLFALKQIFAWRDKTARAEDESYGYVLPNHMMLQIAESLPREMQGIMACCNPIPPLVKQNLPTLHQFVLKAREQSLVKAVPDEATTHRDSQISNHRDFENPLYCPHDILPADTLPCLLTSLSAVPSVKPIPQEVKLIRPKLTVFCSEVEDRAKKVKQPLFVTPYQRYKIYLPTAQAQKEKEDIENIKPLCPEPAPPEKRKLDDDEEAEDTSKVERIIKKRKLNLPGPSHSIEIFNGHPDQSSEDEEKNLVEELASSRTNGTPKGTPQQQKNVNNKPLSKKKQRQLEKRRKQQDNSVEKVKGQSQPNQLPADGKMGDNNRRAKQQRNKQVFKNNRQDSNQPVDFSHINYDRFGGGSKQTPKKQFEITQKFQSKNQNKKNHRGNFKK